MLTAIPNSDQRLNLGGDLTTPTTVTLPDGTALNYFDTISVDESGTVTIPAPNGVLPTYRRYWKIEADPSMAGAIIITVRAVAANPGRGKLPEETTFTTIRSF